MAPATEETATETHTHTKKMKTLDPIRLSLLPAESWHTPAYLAKVYTFRIAREITGTTWNVSRGEETHRPPFSLRLRRAYRTPETQAFRDTVARIARETRHPAVATHAHGINTAAIAKATA